MATGDDGQIGRTNASGADFRGAILTAADMRMANLRGAKLQGADMQGVRFEGALLERTELLYDDFSDYRLKAPALIEEWLRQNLEAGVVEDSEMRALLRAPGAGPGGEPRAARWFLVLDPSPGPGWGLPQRRTSNGGTSGHAGDSRR